MKKTNKLYKLLLPIYGVGAIFMLARGNYVTLLVWTGVAGLIVALNELSKKW